MAASRGAESGATVDAELAIDVAEVELHGPRGQHEGIGDLTGRQPRSGLPGDRELLRGQGAGADGRLELTTRRPQLRPRSSKPRYG